MTRRPAFLFIDPPSSPQTAICSLRLYGTGVIKSESRPEEEQSIVTEPRAVATGRLSCGDFFNNQRTGRYRSRFCNEWRTPDFNCTLWHSLRNNFGLRTDIAGSVDGFQIVVIGLAGLDVFIRESGLGVNRWRQLGPWTLWICGAVKNIAGDIWFWVRDPKE